MPVERPGADRAERPKSSEYSGGREAGEGMSVFLEDDLILFHGVDPLAILTCGLFEEGSTLWVSELGQLRREGLAVSRDDIAEFPGHALVQRMDGKFGAGLRSRLAMNAQPYLSGPPVESRDHPPR